MAIPILPVHLTAPPMIAPSFPSAAPAASEAFGNVFADAVARVEQFRLDAKDSVNKFLSGEGEELHTVALKTEQAGLSFDLFLQVRNKVVAAYQEIMRMQV